MSDEKLEESFWLELEAASKALCLVSSKRQSERLKRLFDQLVADIGPGPPPAAPPSRDDAIASGLASTSPSGHMRHAETDPPDPTACRHD